MNFAFYNQVWPKWAKNSNQDIRKQTPCTRYGISRNYPWPTLKTNDMHTRKYHSVSVRSSGDNEADGLLACGCRSSSLSLVKREL